MKYEILQTGSDGNCTIVNDIFMLDCGLSYKKIKDRLKNIKCIFISHQHSDHFNQTTIKQIAYNFPNIKFIVGQYLVDKLVESNVEPKNIFVLNLDKWYDIGIAKVRIEPLYHDVPDCCLKLEMNNKRLFYATDTSKIDHIVAKGYDYYLIEANYDTDEELDNRIQEAREKGEFTHLERVKYTHLSQLQAINWLEKNKGENSVYHFIHEHIEHRKGDNIE